MWGLPLVDADRHAFCKAIVQGFEGQEWEAMSYHYKDLHWAVTSWSLGEMAKVLWALKEANDGGEL